MKWALYNLLFAAAYPALLPGFLLRMARRGGYAARFADRFALYGEGRFPCAGSYVWIHAVSVGEVQVAGQLMREWRNVEPEVKFCFSTTSSTGWKTAERVVSPDDVLIYNPLDFPNFVTSAVKAIRPRAMVLTESEIWPNLILQLRRRNVPLFLVNARVSDRSAPRYRLAKWFFADVFRCFSRIFAQSDTDRERLEAAGADPETIEVSGSFKFDVARRDAGKEEELSRWVGDGRILLGGSTWPGEDEILLEALGGLDGVRLVIAPRHFEKADAVEANIAKAGYRCVRRSRGDTPSGGCKEVLLADTTGELMGLYALADVVFIGKTLCARGGQNMIEPCLCGKPTVAGPHTENFRPVMSDLLAAGAIVQAADADGVKREIARLFSDPALAAGLGARAKAAVDSRRGTVPRCVARIRETIG